MLRGSRRAVRGARRILLSGMLATMAGLIFAASAVADGNFVIGDGNSALNSGVTFWGAQWWKANSLSGGSAPASFKGFADAVATPLTCGGTWSSRPGNSSKPPLALPEFIDVIVSSEITKSGPTISGDIKEVVLVETAPGYEPDPGHAGVGTVVARVCPEEGGPS